MLATESNRWKLFPVTLLLVAVCLGLFAAQRQVESRNPGEAAEAMRRLGGAATLVYYARDANGEQKPVDGLFGPFDIWEGEAWRLVVNVFMHAGYIHLVGNLVGFVFLGYWLETRIGRFDYFVFFMVSGIGSILMELLMGGSIAVGTSGAIYAIFGRLMVLREFDDELKEDFSDSIVGMGIIWLIVCVSLTATGLMPIANWAHFFGIVYGILFGLLQVRTKWKWSRLFAISAFAVAHLLFVPAFYAVVHPVWDARYQWYQAQDESQSMPARIERLEKAVEIRPSMVGAWMDLAIMKERNEGLDEALLMLSRGVYHNRSSERVNQPFESIIDSIKKTGSDSQVLRAIAVIREVFGDEADDWLSRLELKPRRVIGLSSQIYSPEEVEEPTVDPDAPDSAALGVTL